MSSQLPPVASTPAKEWSQEAVSALHDSSARTDPSVGASANPLDADPTRTANPVVFDPAAKVPAPAAIAPSSANPAHADPSQTAHPVVFDPAAKSSVAPSSSTSFAFPETPGPDLPGAFPRTLSDHGKPTAGDTAQQYLGQIQENVGALAQNAVHYLPQSMKEAVAPYLPEGTSVTASASGHDIEHKTSYPSTELTGAGTGERVGGVGALPGRITESSVAHVSNVDLAHSQAGTGAPTLTERAAGYLPQSVKETVAPYLPASAAAAVASSGSHDHQHQTSLPTTEFTGAGTRDHVGGAGALPGRLGEEGVTKLPDERAPHESTNTTAGTIAGAKEAVVGAAATAAAAISHGVNTAQSTVTGTTAPSHSLPSHETSGARPGEHVGGVGALPGGLGETRVAQFPDERGGLPHPTRSLPTTEHDGALAGERTTGVGALPGSMGESSVALLPEERGAAHTSAAAGEHPITTTSSLSQKAGQAVGAASSAVGAAGDKTTSGTHTTDVPTTHASTTHTPTTHASTTTAPTSDKLAPTSDKLAPTSDKLAPTSDKPAPTSATPAPAATGAEKTHHGANDLPNKGDGYGEGYHPADLHPATGDYSGVDTHEAGQAGEKERESSAPQPAGLKEGGDHKVHGGVPGDLGTSGLPTDKSPDTAPSPTEGKPKSKFMDKVKGFAHKLSPGKHEKETS